MKLFGAALTAALGVVLVGNSSAFAAMRRDEAPATDTKLVSQVVVNGARCSPDGPGQINVILDRSAQSVSISNDACRAYEEQLKAHEGCYFVYADLIVQTIPKYFDISSSTQVVGVTNMQSPRGGHL